MANSKVAYTGDGVTTQYNVPFSFISRSHVKVYLNAIELSNPSFWSWINDSTIEFVTAPASLSEVTIKRVTPDSTRLVDFAAGSVLTEADLDTAHLQHFYLLQETKENYDDLINAELLRIAVGGGVAETETDAIITGLVATMLADASANTLEQAVGDINTNGESILHNDALLALLGSANGGMTAFVLDETTIQVDAGLTTLAAKFSALVAADSGALAAIASEESARISGDAAVASTVSLLDTRVGANEAAIIAEQTARSDGDSAVAATVTTLAARVTTTEGDIAAATISINANASAITDTETDITSLMAHYGVTLNVNGYITGFAQNNDGTTGTFVILADKFAIVDPTGDPAETEYVPFSVSGGVVSMQNVVINGSLLVDGTINGVKIGANSIAESHLAINSVTAAKINATNLSGIFADLGTITAGNITLDTSGYIRGGQTAYDTGSGFFLGYESGAYKFSIGDAGSNSLTWDGTTLEVKGTLHVGSYAAADTETILSATTLRDTTAGTWVVAKEFNIAKSGTVRCVFDVLRGTGTVDTYPQFQVKVNTTIVSGPTDITSTSLATQTIDVTIGSPDDNVVIEYKSGLDTGLSAMKARVQNAYIKVATQTGDAVITD